MLLLLVEERSWWADTRGLFMIAIEIQGLLQFAACKRWQSRSESELRAITK